MWYAGWHMCTCMGGNSASMHTSTFSSNAFRHDWLQCRKPVHNGMVSTLSHALIHWRQDSDHACMPAHAT
jgi:hypothetical protein